MCTFRECSKRFKLYADSKYQCVCVFAYKVELKIAYNGGYRSVLSAQLSA